MPKPLRFALLPLLGLAALTSARAGEAPAPAARTIPPRLSELMGLGAGWQRQFVSSVDEGTLLNSESWAEGRGGFARPQETTAAILHRAVDLAGQPTPAATPAPADEAPVRLPEHARPADYAASGFASATTAASGYSHARFAADLLATPVHAEFAADWQAASLTSTDDARRTPIVYSAEPAARTSPGPVAWNAVPGAAFVPAAYPSHRESIVDGAAAAIPGPLPQAASPSGAVYGFGNNFYGQQGTATNNGVTGGGAIVTSPAPANVLTSGVTALAAGGNHSLALVNGAVYSFGLNSVGQLGYATNSGSTTANPNPAAIPALSSGVTAIGAGGAFSLAVQNGRVYAWGFNSSGQLGNTNGNNTTGVVNATPTLVQGVPPGATAVAGGSTFTLAVANGNVYAFGSNQYGQLGNTTNTGSTTANPSPTVVGGLPGGVTAVAAGLGHSLALRNGVVYAWGYNQYGQLGTTSNSGTSTSFNSVPAAISSLPAGVSAIAAGSTFTLAIVNGNVWSFGYNNNGQLGNGVQNTNVNATPYQVQFNGAALSGIIAIAANGSSSYAVASDGNLYAWGNNNNGQLGLGNTTNTYYTPQLVPRTSGLYYQTVSGGPGSSFALVIEGTSPVPEPATWAGGALLLAAAGWTLRRRVQSA